MPDPFSGYIISLSFVAFTWIKCIKLFVLKTIGIKNMIIKRQNVDVDSPLRPISDRYIRVDSGIVVLTGR